MSLHEKDLKELTKMAFSKKYEYSEAVRKFKGKSGKVWTFDAIVKKKSLGNFGIFIRDWKRELSITQLRQLYKACMDVPEIQGGIMVCNIVSSFSQDFSSQFGIKLVTKELLTSAIRNN